MKYLCFGSLVFLLFACGQPGPSLPVLGEKNIVKRMENGQEVYDSTDHVIPTFTFYNQAGAEVTEKTVDGKIYLADFFFTSCPTICPKVKANMMKVYEQYKDREDFLILSHSIDVKHDTIKRLAWYAEKIGIDVNTWHLLTGKHDDIYRIAREYYIAALVDDDAPGGFDHSGYVALLDRQRRIRGFYDGTDPEAMKKLSKDIATLYQEK